MDDSTLSALEAALEATPQNAELAKVVLTEWLERGEASRVEKVLQTIAGIEWPDSAGRHLEAQAQLLVGNAESALELVGDDESAGLLRAKTLLALDRLEEARDAYDEVVAANPTLEDPDLESRLKARVRSFPSRSSPGRGERGDGRPALRVISNDDTTSTELSRLLQPTAERVSFDDVGGLEPIKEQIRRRIILPFQKPGLFRRFKKKVGGGILLFGPPGCGKTLLARATAGECDAQFWNVAISDVLDMYIGESEQKLHAIFEQARRSTPAVLFFDELEGLGGKRQYTREATSSKLVSQFLSELDGFSQNNQGVLILGATNVPWAVDSAFRRPGRFDRVLFVPPPDRLARRTILDLILRDRPLGDKVDLDAIAQQTSGFSGADLDHLAETAADLAIEESLEGEVEVGISQQHLKKALQDVKPTTLEWLTTARNYARYANEGGQYDEVLEFLRRHGRN